MAGLNILSVNAHPHDFTHYAGTLGIHVADGDTVTVVSMTSGATTHNQALAEELAKPMEERDRQLIDRIIEEYAGQKIEELRTACGVFGITDVPTLARWFFRTHAREARPVVAEKSTGWAIEPGGCKPCGTRWRTG